MVFAASRSRFLYFLAMRTHIVADARSCSGDDINVRLYPDTLSDELRADSEARRISGQSLLNAQLCHHVQQALGL